MQIEKIAKWLETATVAPKDPILLELFHKKIKAQRKGIWSPALGQELVRRALKKNPGQKIEIPELPEPPEPTDPNGCVIKTTQFQSWRVVALMKGLGFSHQRDHDDNADIFTHPQPVKCIYDGWTPSKDGSRLFSFEQLSDPNSVHYGRHYITAFRMFRVKNSDENDNVLVWDSSSSSSAQLFSIIGLGSYKSWEKMIQAGNFKAWEKWFESHGSLNQGWQVRYLLSGLGFSYQREESGEQAFTHANPVECIHKKGLLAAFRFTGLGGYDNILVWDIGDGQATAEERSITISDSKAKLVGLGSFRDWQNMVVDEPERFGLSHWLENNGILC